MSGYDNPLVLVTRPRAMSEEFVAALTHLTTAFTPLIVPAFELEAVEAAVSAFDEAIFTSRAGVRFGPEGEGRIAWCVGEATAAAARQAGYETRHSQGNAVDLGELILNQRPKGRLVHFRGEIVAHKLAVTLTNAGLDCAEAVVYRKAKNQMVTEHRDQIERASAILIPVFSSETVSIIEGWGMDLSHSHVIAISPDVATVSSRLAPTEITVLMKSTSAEMTQAVARLIA